MAQEDERRGEQAGPERPVVTTSREKARAHRELDGDAASYQAHAESAMPERARVTETGTAARAENAAGLEQDEQHLDAARRAMRESRGGKEPSR